MWRVRVINRLDRCMTRSARGAEGHYDRAMRLAAAMALLVVLLLAPASASARPTGRLLVTVQPGTHLASSGPRVPQIGLVTVAPRRGESVRAAARRLRATKGVEHVEVEHRATPRLIPDDPAMTDPETAPGTPEGTVVQWWAQRVGLPEVWDVVRGDRALVAVVDSGVDGGHPDLQGKIRATIDADGTPGAGGPLVDEAGHGTHVASLACAAAGNGVGIAGAGLDCGLIVAKIDFTDASVASAIVQSADKGASAINLSFGTDGSRPAPAAVRDAIAYASVKGAVLVAAAADEDVEEQGDPANLLQPTGTGGDLDRNAGLSVTASTFTDQRAPFAGRGSQISLAAPGAFERGAGPRGLLGSWPQGVTSFERGSTGSGLPPCLCRTPYRGDSRYAYLQGTSMATALVSGVAALVKQLNPDLPAADVVRLLKETARRPPGTGFSGDLGWGVLDARAAVSAARLIDRRPPTSVVRAPRRTRKRTVTLRLVGSDPAPPGIIAAGVDRYEIWRSSYGRRAKKLVATRRSKYVVPVRPGGRYAFHTVAIDRAGNREAAPARADVTVVVPRS